MELAVRVSHGAAAVRLVARAREMEERALNRCGASCKGGNTVVQSSTGPRHGKYGKVGAATCGGAVTNGEWRCGRPTGRSGTRGTSLGLARVVWTSLGPLPRWVPGPTTRWAPGTTRLVLHGT
jgi:hypothetical protein